VVAKKAIPCYVNDKKTIRTSLKKGEKVTFIGSDEKSSVLIKRTNGKSYWIKKPVGAFWFDGNELFDGVCNAD